MSDAVASRLLDSGMKTGDAKKALSLSEVYDTVQGAIWSDLAGTGDIGLMRRNLQREHVRRVTACSRAASARRRRRARAAARERARADRESKRGAVAPGLSKEARAHLADSLNTLEEALRAPMQRMS